MFPKTTTYKTEDDIFIVKHENLMMNLEEAKAVGVVLEEAYRNPRIRAVVFDNSDAKGIWKPDVADYWNDLTDRNRRYLKKTITLTNSAVSIMQINRLSKKYGAEKYVKAFRGKMSDEVRAFIAEK